MLKIQNFKMKFPSKSKSTEFESSRNATTISLQTTAKNYLPKPPSEHCSLPHLDPDAGNGGAKAALPKRNRSTPGST